MKIVIIDSKDRLTSEEWKSIWSRIDFLLERHAPTLLAALVKDKNCPPRKDPPIEDSI